MRPFFSFGGTKTCTWIYPASHRRNSWNTFRESKTSRTKCCGARTGRALGCRLSKGTSRNSMRFRLQWKRNARSCMTIRRACSLVKDEAKPKKRLAEQGSRRIGWGDGIDSDAQLISRGMVPDAAVSFAGGELPDAKLRQIHIVALIDLRHRQVRGLDDIFASFHFLRGIRIVHG